MGYPIYCDGAGPVFPSLSYHYPNRPLAHSAAPLMPVQHARKCLDIAWAVAKSQLKGNPGSAPNCLRLAFHDAGTFTTSSDEGG